MAYKNSVQTLDFVNYRPVNSNFECTNEVLTKTSQAEASALVACGAMLGLNHIVMELVDSYLTDFMTCFNRYKSVWFRFEIKQHVNEFRRELNRCIALSRQNSPQSTEEVVETSDWFYDNIRHDVDVMLLGTENELNRRKIPQADAVARFLVLDVLMVCIRARYNNVLDRMVQMYGSREFYDSWYSHASGFSSKRHLEKAVELYSNRYMDVEVAADDIKSIRDGIVIVVNKLERLNHVDRLAS